MKPEDRIIKAKINLLVNMPWFGQLACYLNLKERKQGVPTAAINERGDFFYNPDFIEKLSDAEIKGLVCHEILHLAFQHPFRIFNRNPLLWNFAADLKVNSEIRDANLVLPTGGLVPDYPNDWEFGGLKITEIDKKTTEQIYDELYRQTPEFEITFNPESGGYEVDVTNLPKPWQDLIKKMVKDLFSGQSKEDEVPSSEAMRLAREWQERVNSVSQRVQGDIPAGLARELLALENPELPWIQIIRQRLTKLEKTLSWKRPSKKWLPYYFPGGIKRKSITAVLAIDTSGSMTERDIAKAISEIWGLALAFRTFKFWIVFNDAEVWDVVEVTNGNYTKIRSLKPKGGGGTDFRPVFKLIKDRWEDRIDCLVFFTDGYGDFPDKAPAYQVYWVSASDDINWPFGQFIRFKLSN